MSLMNSIGCMVMILSDMNRRDKMNQYDVSGILRTYSEQARYARSTKQLRQIIKNLKEEFDLRKIVLEKEADNE